VWGHRTKAVGIATGAAGGIQQLLAQYGHVIPVSWHGALLAAAGMIMFLVGLYNTFQ
jgi:membrane-bound ClpP family serine protease